jgi:superfamily II DNA or RNA helicase
LKDANDLLKDITSLPPQKKGLAFEELLAELYQGNGWLVQVQGGRGDDGADLLLFHPKTPSKISYIVQAKNHGQPLTYDQTRIELVKFEEKARDRYNCNNFRLVSVSGYVKEASTLGDFNMLLDDWEHVIELVEHSDPENKAEPQIELFAHNRITYERINELWEEEKHVAAVQATGTGKSFLISKVLSDSIDKRKIVLAPSNYILEQQQAKIPWIANVVYMTYAKLGRMSAEEIAGLNPELIVLDEFHRCGADVWGEGVQILIESNPGAKVLGTSATPIRYLDNERDMAEELFDSVVAVDLSLAEAIVRRILPAPTYISALYTLNEELETLLADVDASRRSEEEKAGYREKIKKASLDWEKSSGVPDILKRHLPLGTDKLIVFCRDQQHLDEMEIEVQRWFLKAGTHPRRKTYRVLSSDPESDRNLEDFKKAEGNDSTHLLFAIDMLNEGLHIPEVGAVLLLRPTESPIIFYQQIGRCIEVGKDHTPVIFDLVNNFRNVRVNDFLGDIEEASEAERQRRSEHGLSGHSCVVHVEELATPIEEIFESIRKRLVSWEVMFDALVEFKRQFGHCYVPIDGKGNRQLGEWANTQRALTKKGQMTESRYARLEEIGFSWDPKGEAWRQVFETLCEYKDKYGHCNVTSRDKENPSLGEWIKTQRGLKKRGLLLEDRARLLDEVGVVWDVKEFHWEKMFQTLCEYKNVYGDCNVASSHKKNKKLFIWVQSLRASKRSGTLPESKVLRLEEIGFEWKPYEDLWEKRFKSLCDYKALHGHCNVPTKYKENPTLGGWVGTLRGLKRQNKLPDDKIKRIEEIGFVWSPHDKAWDTNFEILCKYREVHGHCDVKKGFEDNPALAIWVASQRARKKRLSDKQIQRLEEIGFDWEPRK